MPPVNLTENAIATLSSGNALSPEIKPVVQVTDICLFHRYGNERCEILLSDGSFTMLGNVPPFQLHDLVRSNKLQEGSIVRLTSFFTSQLKQHSGMLKQYSGMPMMVVVLDLDVMVERCERIGEPRPYYPNTTFGNVSSAARSPMNQPAGSNFPASAGEAAVVPISNARIDWKETPEAHVFDVEVPGLKREEVKVEVEDGTILQISGERSCKEQGEKTNKWRRGERSGGGKFLHRFMLPEDANLDRVKAAMGNGVLTVTVPKEQVKKPVVRAIYISGR